LLRSTTMRMPYSAQRPAAGGDGKVARFLQGEK
jgi:hypothetical protein